jgi:hypothetical protein
MAPRSRIIGLGTLAAITLLMCSARPQNNTTETKPVTNSTATDPTNKVTPKTSDTAGGVSKKDYELLVSTSTDAKVGSNLITTIILTPAAGLHVNQEYPHKITLAALPPNVECAKTEFKKEDAKKFTEERAEFEISCTTKESGPKEFQAEYRLSVCTDNYCATPKEKLAWKFDVK